jgi:hypothetical protein
MIILFFLTWTAEAPRSLRQGQVLMACWNLIDQLTPIITLSFLNSVTESTFSILDTKYSSVIAKTKYFLVFFNLLKNSFSF